MLRINLLPAKVRKTKGAQRLVTYVIMGASGVAILLVLTLLGLLAADRRVQTRLAQADAALGQMADKLSYLQDLTAREKTSQQLRELIRKYQPAQGLWISILDEFADLVPDDLWLTQLAAEPAKKGQPLTLSVEGEAYTKISVADFLAALESSPLFGAVNLEALNDVKTGGVSQVQFKVRLIVKPEAAAGGAS